MTYALVDNATLTSAQRIMGEVVSRSKSSVDIDIVALENLIQAILFYDKIISIDDYKEEHRQNRAERFSFIKFLRKDTLSLAGIESQAYSEANAIRPQIRAGEFENAEFQELIETLKTHMICTWDISSSVYFLTLKMLGEQDSEDFVKYGNLAAAIFSELQDCTQAGGKSNPEVVLYDSMGKRIDSGYTIKKAKWGNGETGGMTAGLQAFVASLVWLANRAIFYTRASHYLQADSFIHPIRQAYQQNYVSKSLQLGTNYTKNILSKLSETLSKDMLEIQTAGLSVASAIDVPVFSAWLVNQTGDASKIISAAIEIRDRPSIKEIRDQLREIKITYDEADNIVSANKKSQKLLAEINKVSADIRSKYAIKTAQGLSIRRLVQVYNTAASLKGWPQLPEYDGKIPIPQFLNLKKQTGLGILYSDVSHDLSKVWALGGARDLLGKKVIIDDSKASNTPRAESPKYSKSHSPFKSPM